jgi:hypothetical protein
MVAVIHYTRSLRMALQYNEWKVQQGKALCIGAFNYPKDAELLSFREKLNRLAYRAALNENIQSNCIHMSLNFDPSEKLPVDKLLEIACVFMEGAGYGKQPWLSYEHFDAAHPHIHIISTNVLSNGKRIQTHDPHLRQILRIQREIEQSFGLVKYSQKKPEFEKALKNDAAQKIHYGKTETMKSISRVLKLVLHSYRYTSLEELNAILKLYNVCADRGKQGSFLYGVRGLLYRVLDEGGNKIGVPIKASLIEGKPILSLLEKKFAENESFREQNKNRVKRMIDWCLLKTPGPSFSQLIRLLEKDRIHLTLEQTAKGEAGTVFYIDHKTRSVFNGSFLGENYSAMAIQERCLQQVNNVPKKGPRLGLHAQP